MNSEFNWWLLLVGLIFGGGLVWLVLADGRRRQEDLEDRELSGEAAWIRQILSSGGQTVDQEVVEAILQLHGEYLASPPPDEVEDELVPVEREPEPGTRETPVGPSARVSAPRGLETPGERRPTG